MTEDGGRKKKFVHRPPATVLRLSRSCLMEYRHLGKTGLRVSEICLGTMQFKWTTDEPTSYAVLDAFYEAGGNFLDTADIYSNWAEGLSGGDSETVIGNWLKRKGCRRFMVVATKVQGRMWDGPNGE